MQINKKLLNAIAILLILSMCISMFSISLIVDAATNEKDTMAFLAVSPNPVGMGQSVQTSFWLQPVPPTITGRGASSGTTGVKYELTLQITKPDGTVEKMGPYKSDPLGIVWVNWTPDKVGNYSLENVFPGQYITGYDYYTGRYYDNTWFKPSNSPVTTLVVQSEQVTGLPDTPLPGPNDYWDRPIQADNRLWAPIAGNWLMRGYNSSKSSIFDSGGGWNPYTLAPNSAHVLWTKEIALGGLMGGETDWSYYTGLSYECKVTPPVIMNGRLYYNVFTDRRPYLYPTGFVCVDLRSGEQIWEQNGSIQQGQILNYVTPNQMGGIPYLWDTTGVNSGATSWGNFTVASPPSTNVNGPWYMYDAFTGDLIWTLTGAYAAGAPGQIEYDQNGNMIAYIVNGAAGWLVKWNSTKVAGDDEWSYPDSGQWRPPQGTFNWSNGIQWNVTIPKPPITSANLALHEMSSGVLVFRSDMTYYGFDENDGHMLWGPVNHTWTSSYKASGQGIWVEVSVGGYGDTLSDMKVHAFSLFSGQEVWASDPAVYPWSYMSAYPLVTADAVYNMGYDGYVHAYNVTTGKELWKYYSGDSGADTPYGHYPFYHGTPVVADGKVFAATGEHSPTQPLLKGERLHVINATTGQGVWNISGWMTPLAVADGILLAFNAYDNRLYAFGKGQTETTITTSPTVSTHGTSVMIQGTVTDQSPGAKGTPAISDNVMSTWMEYTYRQKEKPTNAVGVQVSLDTIDPNGNNVHIGTVTSDSSGMFKKLWTPEVAGEYTVIATFAGSESYWPSNAQIATGVTDAPQSLPSAIPSTSVADTYFIPALVGIFIAFVIIAALILLMLRKRP